MVAADGRRSPGGRGHRVERQAQKGAKVQALTPLDYMEIRQLVARYGYAVDTGADNGNMYTDLFAPDGAFLDRTGKGTTGRDALAAVARRFQRGPQSQFHFLMNHVIEATADGARGKEYLLQLRMGEPGHENEMFGGGHYEDTYQRTPGGWRFKTRQFIPSDLPAAESAVAGAAANAPINGGQPPLSSAPLGVVPPLAGLSSPPAGSRRSTTCRSSSCPSLRLGARQRRGQRVRVCRPVHAGRDLHRHEPGARRAFVSGSREAGRARARRPARTALRQPLRHQRGD